MRWLLWLVVTLAATPALAQTEVPADEQVTHAIGFQATAYPNLGFFYRHYFGRNALQVNMLPNVLDGGDYVFLRRAYGRVTAFLFGWMSFAIVRTGSQAALGVSFALFLNVALGGALDATLLDAGPVHLTWLTAVAVAAVWGVTLINLRPVTTSGGTAGRSAG